MTKPNLSIIDRFWLHVDKRNPDECWNWTASQDKHGYGLFHNETNKTVRAHIWIYEQTHDSKPEVVRHSCDNPSCVNPKHLIGGTQLDNMQDMVTRRRQGSRVNVPSKLTWGIVQDIRSSDESGSELSRKYHVSRQLISLIRQNKAWKVNT